MSLQNRVDPFGAILASTARGTMMGNRGGMFHDPVTRTLGSRRWASRRWLCCSLGFAGSHRHPVWSRGYTQLFFLDEVAGLAAGHRPCAECRRPDAIAFRSAASVGLGHEIGRLADLDLRLDGERRDGREQRRHAEPAASLPDGAIIAVDGMALAIRAGRALPWSAGGYGDALRRPTGTVHVLTPPTTLAALREGYVPLWHPTAMTGGA